MTLRPQDCQAGTGAVVTPQIVLNTSSSLLHLKSLADTLTATKGIFCRVCSVRYASLLLEGRSFNGSPLLWCKYRQPAALSGCVWGKFSQLNAAF